MKRFESRKFHAKRLELEINLENAKESGENWNVNERWDISDEKKKTFALCDHSAFATVGNPKCKRIKPKKKRPNWIEKCLIEN